MQPSIEKLLKFFKLETERGFDNRAVVGGLEKILPNWEAEARIDKIPESSIQLIRTRITEYSNQTENRETTLKELWLEIITGSWFDRIGNRRPFSSSPPQRDFHSCFRQTCGKDILSIDLQTTTGDTGSQSGSPGSRSGPVRPLSTFDCHSGYRAKAC